MYYSLRTSFYEHDSENNEIGKFDCRATIEETGCFDSALSVYRAMLTVLLGNLQTMEGGVDFYGR